MKLTYFGHSCFVIEAQGYKIALDPYDLSVPGYEPLHIEANAVYCSHEHHDHNYTEAVTLIKKEVITAPIGKDESVTPISNKESAITISKSESILSSSNTDNPFTIFEFVIPHDGKNGSLRGMNTVRVFECEGKRIAHMGDIGCMPNPEQLLMLKNLDAMLIPIGGTFTIDSKQAAELVRLCNPKMAIPMHYRKGSQGFANIADISECETLQNQKCLAVGETLIV